MSPIWAGSGHFEDVFLEWVWLPFKPTPKRAPSISAQSKCVVFPRVPILGDFNA